MGHRGAADRRAAAAAARRVSAPQGPCLHARAGTPPNLAVSTADHTDTAHAVSAGQCGKDGIRTHGRNDAGVGLQRAELAVILVPRCRRVDVERADRPPLELDRDPSISGSVFAFRTDIAARCTNAAMHGPSPAAPGPPRRAGTAAQTRSPGAGHRRRRRAWGPPACRSSRRRAPPGCRHRSYRPRRCRPCRSAGAPLADRGGRPWQPRWSWRPWRRATALGRRRPESRTATARGCTQCL
jgi:hypothetical protein